MKKACDVKKNTKSLEEQINSPFEKDDALLHMAWSLSAYMQLDSCSPVYVLM